MNAAKRIEIFQRLKAQCPAPKTELNYSSPFELLVAVVLSAQATDVGVNKATARLFPVANTPEAIAELGVEGLSEHIKTIGLYNSKARHVIALCRQLLERHDGEVPDNRAALEALPGVGRKTANVVLNIRSAHDCGGHAHLSSVQPHAYRTGKIGPRSRRPADASGAQGVPAGRASLADPAWTLYLQGP